MPVPTRWRRRCAPAARATGPEGPLWPGNRPPPGRCGRRLGQRRRLRRPPSLAGVTLDLAGWSHRGLAWVATGVAQCPTLPQQVPALVEFDLDAVQLVMLFGLGDIALPQTFSECFLGGDQVADMRQGVAVRRIQPVAHRSSVPDMDRQTDADWVGCIS